MTQEQADTFKIRVAATFIGVYMSVGLGAMLWGLSYKPYNLVLVIGGLILFLTGLGLTFWYNDIIKNWKMPKNLS